MEPVPPKPSRLDLHKPYGPLTPPPVKRILPLRIVKRPDSVCGMGRDDVDDRSPRACSQETDESRDSVPEPPEGEQQLTIPKVRGSRNSRVFGGLSDVDEWPVPLGRDPYLPKDFGGFRDRCFMSPRQGMSPPYRPFPGLLGDIIQRSRTSNALVARGDSDGPLHLPRNEHGDCSILVPEVRVTPDTKTVDHGYHNFWVAIEVEGTGDCGSMYDVRVDVEATAHSSVLEVIKNYSAPGTLAPGSRLLVLANVELRTSPSYSLLRGHVRSQSDELMDDLEHHLGSAQCDYLRVNLIYRHTAFPSFMTPAGPDNSDNDDGNTAGCGVTGSQTKVRTTFTASITRHNSASPWSPPPAPAPSRLAGIIAAHWGLDAADELLRTRLARDAATPRKTTYLSCPGGGGTTGIDGTGSVRNGYGYSNNYDYSYSYGRRGGNGFRRPAAARVDENERGVGMMVARDDDDDNDNHDDGDGMVAGGYDGEHDPASRIWARLGRGSGPAAGHYCGAAARSGSGSGSKTGLTDMTNQQQHQQHQQRAAVGPTEALDRKRGIRKVSGKSRRGSGRWGFVGNWWA